MTDKSRDFSPAALARFRHYRQLLAQRQPTAAEDIPVSTLAEWFNTAEKPLRQELAALTGSGGLRRAYPPELLLYHLEEALGCHDLTDLALVGCTPLARALMQNPGFGRYGLSIRWRFSAETMPPPDWLPLARLPLLCQERPLNLAILTSPPETAQADCELLLSCGIRGIWNVSGQRVQADRQALLYYETFGQHEDVANNEELILTPLALARQLGWEQGWLPQKQAAAPTIFPVVRRYY